MTYYNPEITNKFLQNEKEKADIKSYGVIAGILIIIYVVLQNALSVVCLIDPFRTLYYTSDLIYYAFISILSLASIALPALFAAKYLNEKKQVNCCLFDMPRDIDKACYLICFGFLLCLAGNYATSYFCAFIESFGFKLDYPELEFPASLAGRLVYLFSVAFVPPLCEELLCRGVVLQPLRKYGDWFAIIMSSYVFALLHGNLVQAPFAFIAGIGLGYAACKTNTIWVPIIIHFINNFYSVMVEIIVADIPEGTTQDSVYYISLIALVLICTVGSVFYFKDKNNDRLYSPVSDLSTSRKTLSYIFNLPMIAAIIIMLFITTETVSFVGA